MFQELEATRRQRVFATNVDRIAAHNAASSSWKVCDLYLCLARALCPSEQSDCVSPTSLCSCIRALLQMALNAFADLTAEEFAATHLGSNPASPGAVRPRPPGD